ncbi:transposase family protein [Streptomyces sp. NPDC001820]|uniref:transposase family protein n=1 Tax=Streptomyces sp. NPDC001820 TaxID=3364613 RepID=UPI0036924655
MGRVLFCHATPRDDEEVVLVDSGLDRLQEIFGGRWEKLSAGQQAVNRSHARIRALGEQAMATLKTWRLLRKLRCSTTRITELVQAVLTLHLNASG